MVTSRPELAYGDYTVYSTTDQGTAYLLDHAGNEVHRWEAPFKKIWPNPTHVVSWLPEQFVYMRRSLVYPNGDLLALYESTVTSPFGCGLVKIDKDSNVLWTFDANAHHDVHVDEDGKIYVLTNSMRRVEKGTKLALLTDNSIVMEDSVTMLSPDGEVLKRVSLLDALLESRYFRPLSSHIDHHGDYTHSNTSHIVGAEFAARHEGVEPGDLMICLRNIDLVAIINLQREELVWATTGQWNHPHDPDPLPNGNILIFNNVAINGTAPGSTVIEFDPIKNQVVWSYAGTDDFPLRSDIRGCQQPLPNGNVLITESERGRMIEVNRDGETVWEFVTPVRGGDDSELIPVICGALRYTDAELPFLQDQRTSSKPAASLTAAVE